MNALLKKEWIALYARDDRKKTYLITDKGRAVLEREVRRLKLNYTLGQQILNGGDENGSD